jgi:acyl dehydratase
VSTSVVTEWSGPYFDELAIGQRFASPAVTLTDGLAAVHQAVLGDRLALPLDRELSRRVLSAGGSLAHPALVWDVAIGQSTPVTQHVVANMFYRGLSFRRFPVLGDTLMTTTEVVALRANRPKPGRDATGLALLAITTVDQDDRTVLDFQRCAMLPVRRPDAELERHCDLGEVPAVWDDDAALELLASWDLTSLRERCGSAEIADGTEIVIDGGDVVAEATALTRLSLNQAAVHHDRTRSAQGRLVYGGHTIGLAFGQVTRALPQLVTVTSWRSCAHTGPVHEQDTLFSRVTVIDSRRVHGGCIAHLHVLVDALAPRAAERRAVLDWQLTGVLT